MTIVFLCRIMIIIFDFHFQLFPPSGRGTLAQLVMPSLTLAIGTAAQIIPLVRSSMLEIVHEDYIRTARSKGLAERVIIYRHAFKNALIPVITMVALQIPGLFGGALLAGLLGRKRGKRQPDKRQSKERARAVPRRKRR